MSNFNQEFTIHPVGQGLFYSGLIEYNNSIKFRMVFDCGSVSKGACQEEVHLYRNQQFIKENIIDLLVISHFDADHVNQIKSLLSGNVKVKKLVMPFLCFEERLVLAMRYIYYNIRNNDPENFIISFIIDPLGTIAENLDGDSEVLLMDNSPNEPPVIPDETNNSLYENKEGFNERFEFRFTGNREKITDNNKIFKSSTKPNIFKLNDSEKGILFSNNVDLMEFLFYKKTISLKENIFYDQVRTIFYNKFLIDASSSQDKLLTEVVEKIKEIKSATIIKNIFDEAKNKTEFKLFKNVKINDLNTTALCMLHRNLSGILNLINISPEQVNNWPYRYLSSEIINIHKFPQFSRIEEFSSNRYHHRYNSIRLSDDFYEIIFPNVLLTSDSFLLTEEDVTAFLNHYKNYWDTFWLFQIPHHGSDKSSNNILHSSIPRLAENFINYGINNRDNHPSNSVIISLILSKNSIKTHPVNQYLGLKFNLYN